MHLSHIVVVKVFVAGGVELNAFTEELPQLGGDRHVIDDLSLKTLVKLLVL